MKRLLFLSILAIIICSSKCAKEKYDGTIINGKIEQAANLPITLQKLNLNNAGTTLEKVETDAEGNFEIRQETMTPGTYRLNIGAKQIGLLLEGNESNVTINAKLAEIPKNVNITGSATNTLHTNIMTACQKKGRGLRPQHVQQIVDTCSNPLVGAFVTNTLVGRNAAQFLHLLQKAEKKLVAAYPDADFTKEYSSRLSSIKIQAMKANELVPADKRQLAKNIKMPNPEGKEYSLEDLKGKVVLLDFWASWCGPCRKANPHVVQMYKKYKDQGFTVFNVSLDRDKKRWEAAIKKDGLEWEYHVSDLKHWRNAAAQMYGVSSIPRTFLLDKNGKIAANNFKGAALEGAIEKLLKE